MNLSATILLGMSMDAFAASIGKGAKSCINPNSQRQYAPGFLAPLKP